MLEPIGDYVIVQLDAAQECTALWTPPKGELAKQATVLRAGNGEFQAGDRVLIALRQAMQVGSEFLLPCGGVLARLD